MIFDKIDNAGRYLGISKNLDLALTYLMKIDIKALDNGVHEIAGEQIFMNIMNATTKPNRDGEYEYHKKYYDIQIDIVGEEDVLFSMQFEKISKSYQDDIGFGICKCDALCHLRPGYFVICEPEEPHLPGIALNGESKEIRKAVIKVQR